jgi:hypothetical protein
LISIFQNRDLQNLDDKCGNAAIKDYWDYNIPLVSELDIIQVYVTGNQFGSGARTKVHCARRLC